MCTICDKIVIETKFIINIIIRIKEPPKKIYILFIIVKLMNNGIFNVIGQTEKINI